MIPSIIQPRRPAGPGWQRTGRRHGMGGGRHA